MATPLSIKDSINAHLATLSAMRDKADVIERLAGLIGKALDADRTIYTCGNGGSAAEALHLAEEMTGCFSNKKRRPLAAVCLNADPTALTCISNDFGFEQVFARQVQCLIRQGDVLVVLSTSGKSPNILQALEAARANGATRLGLLGSPGSPAEALCDAALTLAAPHNAHTQEMHLMAIHLILEQLDARFGV